MQTDSYLSRPATSSRPNIIEVIGRYVELRRISRDNWRGLCPLHSEKTPSFTVNEEKQVFYCFGCQIGGDVIRFIQLIEGVDFKRALEILGMAPGDLPPRKPDSVKAAALIVATWAGIMADRCGAQLREIGQKESLCQSLISLPGVANDLEACRREWAILETLSGDLSNPDYAVDLFQQREFIEGLLPDDEDQEPAPFPLWTAEYAAYVRSLPFWTDEPLPSKNRGVAA